MISSEVASVVPRFFDAGKGPSHDELTLLFGQAQLAMADPGMHGPEGPIGKMKRVRRVLMWALDHEPERGAHLVKALVAAVRGRGGFRSGMADFVGEDVVIAAREAFASQGYELDPEGELRPAVLENLEGVELTETLWAYVRRARNGVTDAALAVGTSKDFSEATARHVLVSVSGGYPTNSDYPTTPYQAYERLGLAGPDPRAIELLGDDPRAAVQRAVFLLALACNRLRNAEGTGHGRPHPSTAGDLDARLSTQAAGLVSDILLTTLGLQRPAVAAAR